MAERRVVDANGTLFDLAAAAPAGGGQTALEAWFEHIPPPPRR